MNIYNPFIVDINYVQDNSKYIEYSVFSVYTEWINGHAEPHEDFLYSGQTWMNPRGHSEVNISDILKDHVYTPPIEYDHTRQRYYMAEADVNTLTELTPIENGKKFFNNAVWVNHHTDIFDKYDIEVSKQNIYNPFYTIPLNPYVNEVDAFFYNSIGTGVIPEIPYIATDNFYFGWTFGFDKRYKNDKVYLSPRAAADRPPYINHSLDDEYGNYFPLYTLASLWNTFQNPINNLYVTFIGADDQHPVPIPQRVAIVNSECTYDYYVGWFTPWGSWQSQGFNERDTTATENIERSTLTNMTGRKKEYKTDLTFKRTVTKTCGKDMARLLNSIKTSSCIWLYDVKNDYGTPVLCTDSSVSTGINTLLTTVDLTFENIQRYNYITA